MASGHGLTGGPGRCFPFWQEVLSCYIVNTSADDRAGAKKCGPALDDYYECLHHKKEKARAIAIQNAMRKAEMYYVQEDPPTAGEIRSLGLVGKEEISKKFYNRPPAKPRDGGKD